MSISFDEFGRILRALNGPAYPRLHALAKQYISETLADEAASPSLATMISSLFLRASQAFLMRDGGAPANQYRRNAETLDEAVKILNDDPRHFQSLMDMRGAGQTAPISIWALEQVSVDLKRIANAFEQDRKNITFFYCLGRVLANEPAFPSSLMPASLPEPNPETANAVYMVLVDVMQYVAPHSLDGVKTDYDSIVERSDISRALQRGYRSIPS